MRAAAARGTPARHHAAVRLRLKREGVNDRPEGIPRGDATPAGSRTTPGRA
jgi:hypothetical protein